jgi:hypothetical protein
VGSGTGVMLERGQRFLNGDDSPTTPFWEIWGVCQGNVRIETVREVRVAYNYGDYKMGRSII